ncbi:MAG: BON domain-containing protein [Candidatus Omnitrophota bacterium]
MKHQRLLAVVIIGLFCIASIGCASTSKKVASDQSLADQIKSQLEAPTGPAGPFKLDIFVKKGVVNLDGELATAADKEKALSIITATPGVKDVKSFAEVK